jgi:hypothetical protein
MNYIEPLDDADIPISSSYVPNVGFIGTQGSSNINTDGTGKKSSPVNVNLKQIGDVLLSLGIVPTQDIEASGYVAATTPPATTNAGSDTLYIFSSQVNRVIIQNNTSANVNYAFDVASSAGSFLLVPGATLIYPKKVTVLHLYTVAAQNINGTSAGNIVVLGAL